MRICRICWRRLHGYGSLYREMGDGGDWSPLLVGLLFPWYWTLLDSFGELGFLTVLGRDSSEWPRKIITIVPFYHFNI